MVKRKIKIIQVITRMDWGGSPDILRILCKYLNRDIYDLKVVIGHTSHPTVNTRDFLKAINSDLLIVEQLKREINPVYDLVALVRLYMIFKRERPDIVHTHTAKAGALGRLAAFLAGVPAIVHTPHGHNFYGYFNWFASRVIIACERVLGMFCDKLIALTQLEKDDYLKFKVCPDQKIKLIYQGLELDKYNGSSISRAQIRSEYNIGIDCMLVGMIGRLEPVKGPEVFIAAANEVLKTNSNVFFALAGDGSLRQDLESKVKSLALGDKFIFMGWRDDIPEVIAGFDLLVLPSLNEAVGMVLIEAQSSGVPVVASRVGGVAEVVLDGRSGILVEAGNAQGFSAAIKKIIDDSPLRKNMAEAGRSWVKNKFSAAAMAEITSELYQDILKEKCPNR